MLTIDDVDSTGAAITIAADPEKVFRERLRDSYNNGDLSSENPDRLLAALKIFGFDANLYQLTEKNIVTECDKIFRKYSPLLAEDKVKAKMIVDGIDPESAKITIGFYKKLYDELNQAKELIKNNLAECVDFLKKSAITRAYQEIKAEHPNLTIVQYIQLIVLSDIFEKIDMTTVSIKNIKDIVALELKAETIPEFSPNEKKILDECLKVNKACKQSVDKILARNGENGGGEQAKKDCYLVCRASDEGRRTIREKIIAASRVEIVLDKAAIEAEVSTISARHIDKNTSDETKTILSKLKSVFIGFVNSVCALLFGSDKSNTSISHGADRDHLFSKPASSEKNSTITPEIEASTCRCSK